MVEAPAAVRWAAPRAGLRLRLPPGAWPVSLVVRHTFADGLDQPDRPRFADPEVQAALLLTVKVAGIAVLINLVFGVTMSILLVRYEFPGKRAAVRADRRTAVGVAGRRRSRAGARLQRSDGWFGPTLEARNL